MRADHQPSMSRIDRAAHDEASYVSWRAREKYLRTQSANGRIRTAGDRLLADMTGRPVQIEVTVEYVTPVSPDGVAYLIVTGLDRQGTALVVVDGQDRGEAVDWMTRDYASLLGMATTLFGQPGLDLRRATIAAPAAEHEKAKEPRLPQRPRGPHQQSVKAVAS
jgi:hypothetical protein